ncbi:histidine phosphatase family protein [Candidatus Saccharibacteria bacterium]|nr:histidine phosphatase family protein [Candidatus Saccharibacteria bacterium]
MPNELVFVRHGQSEANIIQSADKKGYDHEHQDAINDRPDWKQRLSQLGIEQAGQAKEWIDRNLGGAASFDIRYFSPFLRTRETAAYIGGTECGEWIHEDRVVERSWGKFGALSSKEREKKFAQTAKMYKQSPWYVKLDGGESRYEVSNRFRDFQGTLHREADGKRALVVTHGDLIGIARYNIERMLPEQFEEMENDKTQTVKNCSITQYSRVNPEDSTDTRKKLTWRRIVNPTDIESSPYNGEWIELPPRAKYTGADLLKQAELAPRLLEVEQRQLQ